jgi:apolipoprotein D and lipocalin family protein
MGLAGCAAGAALGPQPQVVSELDLERYLGLWHELARYPNRFQQDCFGSKADYRLAGPDRIRVLNTCRTGGPDGPLVAARGSARVVDTKTRAKLEVSFFRPFWGDYWVLDLGAHYEYAVVGTPDRRYLWVLARRPRLPDSAWQAIEARLREQGFDPDKLIRQ